MVVIFLVGFGFILYPIVANEWNEICRRKVITVYDRQVEQSVEQGKISYEDEKRKADEYNKALRFNITDDGFVSNNDNRVNNSDNDTDEDNNKDNEESSFNENSEYNKCLNLNNDGMMGYISIPKIDVKLPIYHSTDNEVLQKYVGHLEGSSLPVEGDRFYIYVLNQVLTYQVDRIYPMIDKNDKAKLTEALQTKEGEDYITLLTCTPYGVNTHRLLVRGKRVENSNESYDRKLNSNSNLWILGGAAVGIIATSVVLVILIRKGEKAD